MKKGWNGTSAHTSHTYTHEKNAAEGGGGWGGGGWAGPVGTRGKGGERELTPCVLHDTHAWAGETTHQSDTGHGSTLVRGGHATLCVGQRRCWYAKEGWRRYSAPHRHSAMDTSV
jgi:hypothetical protein